MEPMGYNWPAIIMGMSTYTTKKQCDDQIMYLHQRIADEKANLARCKTTQEKAQWKSWIAKHQAEIEQLKIRKKQLKS